MLRIGDLLELRRFASMLFPGALVLEETLCLLWSSPFGGRCYFNEVLCEIFVHTLDSWHPPDTLSTAFASVLDRCCRSQLIC